MRVIPAVGTIIAGGLAVVFLRLLEAGLDLPPLLRFYGPLASAAGAILIVSLFMSVMARGLNRSRSAQKRLTGSGVWGLGFLVGWSIGMAAGGIAAGAIIGAIAGLLSSHIAAPLEQLVFPGPAEADSAGASSIRQEGPTGRPPFILILGGAAILAALASGYTFRSYLPSRLIPSSVGTSWEFAVASTAGTSLVILISAALLGRRANSTLGAVTVGALVGGSSAFAVYALSGFLSVGLIAGRPVLARMTIPFSSMTQMETALTDLGHRSLWMQPVAAMVLLTAGSAIGSLAGFLAGPSTGWDMRFVITLETWRHVAVAVAAGTAASIGAIMAVGVVTPGLQIGARDGAAGLSLVTAEAMQWLPSLWPFIVVLFTMVAGLVISRRSLPSAAEDQRSIAWMAVITAWVPWFAIYPAWQLAPTFVLALLLALVASLMSLLLFLFAHKAAASAGGWTGPLKVHGLSASLKSSVVGALAGVTAAVPLMAHAVSYIGVLLPIWGSLSPDGSAPLRAPLSSYFSTAFRLQGLSILGTGMILFAVTFTVTWGMRPSVKIYQWVVEVDGGMDEAERDAQGGQTDD